MPAIKEITGLGFIGMGGMGGPHGRAAVGRRLRRHDLQPPSGAHQSFAEARGRKSHWKPRSWQRMQMSSSPRWPTTSQLNK